MAAVPMGDRDRLAEILSRYQLGGQPPSAEEARAAADRTLALTTLSQAELAERERRYLTVMPGDLDTAEDAPRIAGSRPEGPQWTVLSPPVTPGRNCNIRAGNSITVSWSGRLSWARRSGSVTFHDWNRYVPRSSS